jgi:hypothetical protein
MDKVHDKEISSSITPIPAYYTPTAYVHGSLREVFEDKIISSGLWPAGSPDHNP